MKYDSLRKLARNEELQEYAKLHPELALKEIGYKFGGLSPSRVWRIIHGNRKTKEKR